MKIRGSFNFLIVVALFFLFALPYFIKEGIKDISYSQFKSKVENGEIELVSEAGAFLLAREKSGDEVRVRLLNDNLNDDVELLNLLKRANIVIKPEVSDSNLYFWIYSFAPMILLGLLLFLISTFLRRTSKSNLINISKVANRTTFKDVAGLEEAKLELMEIVQFLREPFKFTRLGAKIPKGVLMLGKPGTGKTLLARAVAGEAGVAFLPSSGSDFIEMFSGLGAARVRDLFSKAKRHAPCIVFIDEIDTIAKKRGSNINGSNDEREQTLNQLLVEMDGFSENQNVIVMAATNRGDVLDKAILRPGRFDRHVTVDVPTLKEREEILKLHTKNKPMDKSVDLQKIARKTAGFVGADLANIMNEAAIFAARKNKLVISKDDIEDAIERVIGGFERRSRVMSQKEKEIVAHHESGHALISYLLPGTEPIHKISIIPRGESALGYVLTLPNEDKFLWSKQDFLNEIKVLVAGRAAEEIIFEETTSGASNDIERATYVARNMIVRYGMSKDLGLVAFTDKDQGLIQQREFSEQTAEKIDSEVKAIISFCYEESKHIINENIGKLKSLAQHLLKEEIIFEDEVAKIIESEL